MSFLKERGLQVVSLICILIAWEVLARAVDLGDSYPPPTTVLPVFVDLVKGGSAFGPLGSTLGRTIAGFVLGFAVGILYGVLTHVSRRFDQYSRGLFNIVQYSPTLVIIFLGLVILGRNFFTIAMIIGFCIFTEVGVYMRDAFRNFDDELLDMSKSYKVSFWRRVIDLYFPFLIPPMLATARIGFTLAWKIGFLCEVFGLPKGLGWEVRSSYMVYDMPLLLAWLTVFIIALLLIEQVIRTTERVVVKW
jgi:ABC-type nitrate/sulfonate/bicarbonate transport system permease component